MTYSKQVEDSLNKMMFWKKKYKKDDKKCSVKIYSPIEGEVVKLEDVNDEAFSSGILGRGIAIIPNIGKIVSPVNGIISMVFETNHAIAITSNEGVEILIHIGIDTVELKGRGFESHIKKGDLVKVGQLLMNVDIDFIKSNGYDITSPIVITNYNDSMKITETYTNFVQCENEILNLEYDNEL